MCGFENKMTDFDLEENNDMVMLGINELLSFIFRMMSTQLNILIEFIRILFNLIYLLISVCCISLHSIRTFVWVKNCKQTIWRKFLLLLQIIIILKLFECSIYHMNSPFTTFTLTMLRKVLMVVEFVLIR